MCFSWAAHEHLLECLVRDIFSHEISGQLSGVVLDHLLACYVVKSKIVWHKVSHKWSSCRNYSSANLKFSHMKQNSKQFVRKSWSKFHQEDGNTCPLAPISSWVDAGNWRYNVVKFPSRKSSQYSILIVIHTAFIIKVKPWLLECLLSQVLKNEIIIIVYMLHHHCCHQHYHNSPLHQH